MSRKIPFLFVLASIFYISCHEQSTRQDLNILDYEELSNSGTDWAPAFDRAIADCSKMKGRIVVPEGEYPSSTITLLSDVEIHLCEGAEIVGVEDPEAYSSFVPRRDMSQYDSGDGTVNQNNSRDARWNRALILANGVHDITLTGPGRINGRHVFDPLGEEFMRGPHAIVFGDCENVVLDGINICCAANYAFMGYALKNASFTGVSIFEGWDGIHIRGGENIVISDCDFATGDDSIAGGYWTGMEIRDCRINSSCNGIRMIMPSQGVDIHDCTFTGPGRFPHRTSGEKRRCNMLYGIVFEPGGWGAAPGEMGGLNVHDCTMANTLGPIAVSVSSECTARDLTISNVTATGTYGTLSPVINYKDSGFESITVNNYTVSR